LISFLKNIFKIPELRKRILFTFILLAVYRIGAQVLTPGINVDALEQLFKQAEETIFGFINMFSGGSMKRMTIFALGVMPYISASIILQLLQVVWPYLERISKEGELGKRKITQYTRYGTVFIALIQSFAIAIALEKMESGIVSSPGWSFRLVTIITITTGSVFVMWLGEQISDRGIGNGISLIIFAGIIVSMVPGFFGTFYDLSTGDMTPLKILMILLLMAGVVVFIVFVELGQRRIPISYAKRIQGRRMMGGQSTFLPLKLNTGGVIPIIFAAAVITFIPTIAKMIKIPFMQKLYGWMSPGMPMYNLVYVTAIIFFTYFYISIIFNPKDVADNLKKQGGFIPGIRAGKNTSEYIDNVLSKLTFIGAIYLALVAILPTFMMTGFKIGAMPFIGEWLATVLPSWISTGLGVKFAFGGTSLLIVVQVAMDTVNQIESQLTMRNYDSFSKKARKRGGKRR
jgi:preprotein translocase subunit SecY